MRRMNIIWLNGKKTQVSLTRIFLLTFLLLFVLIPFSESKDLPIIYLLEDDTIVTATETVTNTSSIIIQPGGGMRFDYITMDKYINITFEEQSQDVYEVTAKIINKLPNGHKWGFSVCLDKPVKVNNVDFTPSSISNELVNCTGFEIFPNGAWKKDKSAIINLSGINYMTFYAGNGTTTVVASANGFYSDPDKFSYKNWMWYDNIYERWHIAFWDSTDTLTIWGADSQATTWNREQDLWTAASIDPERFDCAYDVYDGQPRLHCVMGYADNYYYTLLNLTEDNASKIASSIMMDLTYNLSFTGDIHATDIEVDSNHCPVIFGWYDNDSDAVNYHTWVIKKAGEPTICADADPWLFGDIDSNYPINIGDETNSYNGQINAYKYSDGDYAIVTQIEDSINVRYFNYADRTFGTSYVVESSAVWTQTYAMSSSAFMTPNDILYVLTADSGDNETDVYRIPGKDQTVDQQIYSGLTMRYTGAYGIVQTITGVSDNVGNLLLYAHSSVDTDDMYYVNSTDDGSTFSTPQLIIDDGLSLDYRVIMSEFNPYTCQTLVLTQGQSGAIISQGVFDIASCEPVLTIISPLTSNKLNTTNQSNETFTFQLTELELNITTGVNVTSAYANETPITIQSGAICEGTLDCGGISDETECGLASQCNWSIGATIQIRSDDDGVADANGVQTQTFSVVDDTNFAAMLTPLTDGDVVYSAKWTGKTTTSLSVWFEDDVGSNEATNYQWAIIEHGYTDNDGYEIQCGTESDSSSTQAVSFGTEMSDTNYASICTSGTDTDSPICILQDTIGKATTGISLYLNDDGGYPETVTSADWCVFDYGETNMGSVDIKAGVETVTNGVMAVDYTDEGLTDFSDTEYVVFITDITSYSGDGCACEVDGRTTSGFTATCADDGSSTANCDEDFDWVALSITDSDAGGNVCGDNSIPGSCADATVAQCPFLDNASCSEGVGQIQWYTVGVGWNVNVTMPDKDPGLYDLNITIDYDGTLYSVIETEALNYSVVAFAESTCDCPSSGNWVIGDSSICTLSTTCNIGANKLRINDGGLHIQSGGQLISAGCYVADTHSFYVDDAGGAYCGG